MKSSLQSIDSYIIDTYKSVDTGHFLPGAIVFKGRKKVETLQWKDEEFLTQKEADAFVRAKCIERGLEEMENDSDLMRHNPRS